RYRRAAAMLRQPGPHRLGAPFRKPLIVLVVALAVGVPPDHGSGLWIALEHREYLFERRAGFRAQIPFVEVEQHVGREVDLDLAAGDLGAEILQRALHIPDLRLDARGDTSDFEDLRFEVEHLAFER